MADILSNLYLAHSVLWYEKNYNISSKLTQYCINRLLYENSILFNRIIDNYPLKLRFLLKNMKRKQKSLLYQDNRDLINEVQKNDKIMDSISENIYLDKTLQDLENLNTLQDEEYEKIYNNIISVEEYKI